MQAFRRLVVLLIVAGVSVSLTGCIASIWCKEGKGDVVTQKREVTAFKSIELKGSGDIDITKSDNISLTIETNENLFDYIATDVDGDKLIIYNRENLCPETLEFHITMPEVENLLINGSGDIKTNNTITGDNIRFGINGAGDISADVDCNGVGVKINGSGDVRIDGKTHKALYTINGAGDITCTGLKADKVKAEIYGAGDCKVYAEEYLEVDIYGAGDVGYKGSPQLDEETKGAGDIYRIK